MNECIFCKIAAGGIPAAVIEENDDVIVIKDIAPKAPIHYLIIPKKHIQDISSFDQDDEALAGKMLMMAKKVGETLPEPNVFRLVINNGHGAGQRVFHAHMHLLAGKVMSGF